MYHVHHPLGDEASKNYNYLNLVTLLEWIITSWRAGHYTSWQYTWLLPYCITHDTQVMKNYIHASHTHMGHTGHKSCKIELGVSNVLNLVIDPIGYLMHHMHL